MGQSGDSVRPYYASDLATLYHGDARRIVPLIDADVLITDPPYGIGLEAKRRSGRMYEAGPGMPAAWHADRFAATAYQDDPEYVRALIADVMVPLIDRLGRALIFPGPRMMFAYPEPRAVGAVFMPHGNGRSSWGFQTSHPIFYYGKDPFMATRPNGFWDVPTVDHTRGHPCPKPLKWMRWAVERASRPGETILDPFVGSGTTLVAARERGRRVVGIEIEERYCELAVQRLAQGVLEGVC